MPALLLPLLLLVASFSSAAPLQVVATSPSGGAPAREMGAEDVSVIVLAPPDRDLHALQARPSMMRALRSADLVIALGADLELGWLPVAIQQAANPRVQPGRPGYFEAAAQVALTGARGSADRALGDVHPLGNPHVNMDPLRWVAVARALANRLAALEAQRADAFAGRAEQFARRVEERLPRWQQQLADAAGVVLYHEDATYLLERFDVPLLGVLEPIPGVPPTAAHIRALRENLRSQQQGVIIHAPYQSAQAPNNLAEHLGWPVVRLPLEPPVDADGAGYLEHMERWIDAMAQAPR